MKKNEKILKIIFFTALVLVVILLILYFQISRQSKIISTGPTPTPSPIYMASLSGPDHKVFKNYDNSYTAVAFTGPVNYVDENGQLQPISTKITTSKMPGYTYEVSTNSIKTYFKDTLNELDYMLVVDGDKKIFQGISKTQGEIGTVAFSKAHVKNNIIIYPEILPGIDLQYTIEDDKVREEFLIKNQSAVEKLKSITEYLTLENIQMQKDNQGNISLGKSLGFYKPEMFELNSQIKSPDRAINYEEVRISNNKFILQKVLANEGIAWLKETTRQFPIIIDPTLTFSGAENADDGFSKQGSSTGANVAGVTGFIGYWSGVGGVTAGLRFHPNIPRSSTITSAYVYIYNTQNIGGAGNTPDLKIRGEKPTAASGCAIYGTAWDNAPGISARREVNATTAAVDWNPYVSNDKWIPSNYSVPNISSVVSEVISDSDWTAGTSSLCIMLDNDTSTTQWAAFDTRESTNTPDVDDGDPCGNNTTDPCIVINYTISTPGSPSATTNNKDYVTVSWSSVTDVGSYKIYYASSSGGAKTYLTTVTGSTSYNDTSAAAATVNAPSSITASTNDKDKIVVTVGSAGTSANGATRYYYVTSLSGGYESGYSTEVSGYRTAGSVSGYDIFYDGDAYASALATNQSSPYNDSAAAAPSVSAPSSLTASDGTSCTSISLTIGTAGVSTNGTSRTYKLKTRTSSGTLSSLSSASNAGYRSYGSVTGYDIYYDGDSYTTPLATNQSSPYTDASAPDAILAQPALTPSAGSSTSQITFNVTGASVNPGSHRTYKAKTRTSSGTLSSISSASTAGSIASAITQYYIQVTDAADSTRYVPVGNNATTPYNWTGCSLAVHGYYRTYYKVITCQSEYSHSSGGVEGYCDDPSATPAIQFEKVLIEKVKIAPSP